MKKIKKTKVISIIVLVIIIILLAIATGLYIGNKDVKAYIDKNIFKKEIDEQDLIQIGLENNSSVYSYGNYIAILYNNTLNIYTSDGKKITSMDVLISNPKFVSKKDYLLLFDENGNNAYLIHNTTMEWKKQTEGEISLATINGNGMCALALSKTTYKTIIVLYEKDGTESFRTYLSTTYTTDMGISEDNKYFSFTEMNTSGTQIISNVKNISIEKAKSTPNDAIENNYSLEDNNRIFINIEYKKDDIVAYADDAIYLLSNGNKDKIVDIDNNVSFADIKLNGYACIVNTKNKDEYELDIYNVESKKYNAYLFKDNVKSIYCYDNIIALNYGNKVEFVNLNGWLIKRFTPTQNFKNIILRDNRALFIYKDRVEILNI